MFIKDEVASRAPRKGQRLKAELAKRKRERPGPGSRPAKRRRAALSLGLEGSASSIEDDEGEEDEPALDLLLLYNSIRGYCSAINELWVHQTSRGLHTAPRPQRVALIALKTSIARGQHQRRRDEYTDRGLATIRDGYIAS